VKGVGQSAVEAIIAERAAQGRFASLDDLCRRLDLNRVNKRVLEALIRSGSLDSLDVNRNMLMTRLPAAMQLGEQDTRAKSSGQDDLFGLAPAPRTEELVETSALPEWPEAVRLAGERDTLGLYLTGHPITQYENELKLLTHGRIADLASGRPMASGENGRAWQPGRVVTVAGLVMDIRKRANRTTLILDDRSGRLEAMLYEEVLQQYRDIIAKDAILLVEGQLRFDDFIEGWRVNARRLMSIEQAREQNARRIVLEWPANGAGTDLMARLAEILAPFRGGTCSIAIRYRATGASGVLTLGEEWCVRAAPELVEQLAQLAGKDAVRVLYGPKAGVPTQASSGSGQ
jgi:DNA polymerase III subunit alpha